MDSDVTNLRLGVPPLGYENKDVNRPLSFTYSDDVINVMLELERRVNKGGDLSSKDHFTVLNVACYETMELKDFLLTVTKMVTKVRRDPCNYSKYSQNNIKMVLGNTTKMH